MTGSAGVDADCEAGATAEQLCEWRWRIFVKTALDEPEAARFYEAETGRSVPSVIPDPPVADDCTVAPPLEHFVRWLTVAHYGVEDAPAAYRVAANLPALDPREAEGSRA